MKKDKINIPHIKRTIYDSSFFFSCRRRHTRYWRDWSSDVCSSDLALWTGAGPHWMLTGTRELTARATEGDFAAQWRDPVVGPELVRLGVESPGQLGATFLADAAQLAPWV